MQGQSSISVVQSNIFFLLLSTHLESLPPACIHIFRTSFFFNFFFPPVDTLFFLTELRICSPIKLHCCLSSIFLFFPPLRCVVYFILNYTSIRIADAVTQPYQTGSDDTESAHAPSFYFSHHMDQWKVEETEATQSCRASPPLKDCINLSTDVTI